MLTIGNTKPSDADDVEPSNPIDMRKKYDYQIVDGQIKDTERKTITYVNNNQVPGNNVIGKILEDYTNGYCKVSVNFEGRGATVRAFMGLYRYRRGEQVVLGPCNLASASYVVLCGTTGDIKVQPPTLEQMSKFTRPPVDPYYATIKDDEENL